MVFLGIAGMLISLSWAIGPVDSTTSTCMCVTWPDLWLPCQTQVIIILWPLWYYVPLLVTLCITSSFWWYLCDTVTNLNKLQCRILCGPRNVRGSYSAWKILESTWKVPEFLSCSAWKIVFHNKLLMWVADCVVHLFKSVVSTSAIDCLERLVSEWPIMFQVGR